MTQTQIHASCVAFDDQAVLIRGPSGSGKSELVLRLIDAEGYGLGTMPQRATLVADDQVILSLLNNKILAKPAPALAGLLEIRGQGIVNLEYVQDIAICLVVDLVAASDVARLPEPEELTTTILGVHLPRLALDGHATAAPAKLRSKCFSSAIKTR
jgi:HPr kinase/phosphorylase